MLHVTPWHASQTIKLEDLERFKKMKPKIFRQIGKKIIL